MFYIRFLTAFLRPVQQYKYDQIFLSMKKDLGKKQHYFGNCTHGGMFFKKSSFVPEILCSSTLLVHAPYISGQHFLRPVQQYKYDQIFLSMKKDLGKKQNYFGNCTHGGMFLKKSSFIPEILCSSTLWVYATYISGQHF